MGSLRVRKQTQIFEDRKRVTCRGTERSRGTVGQIHVFDVTEHLQFVFLDNFVNYKHDQLPERSSGGRGYHRDTRVLKFET